jgi:hypothetical protein
MSYTFSGFPNKIRIGPFDFEIEFAESLSEGDTPLWGMFLPSIGKIRFQRELPCRSMAIDVVLHEVGHGVLANAGQAGDHLREEQVVSAWATGMTQVLLDNPKLVSWLNRTIPRR